MTKAQQALVRLVLKCSPRSITYREAQKYGLVDDFDRCRRAGLIQHAGYETSAQADMWLESAAGRAALAGHST